MDHKHVRNGLVRHADFRDSDHNLMYATVLHRIAAIRRKRGSDNSDGRVTIDLERLKAKGTLQNEFQHRILCSPTITMLGSTVDEVAAAFTDTVLTGAVETGPRTNHRRRSKGWCASEAVKGQIHEA